jgi:hypothetical protein
MSLELQEQNSQGSQNHGLLPLPWISDRTQRIKIYWSESGGTEHSQLNPPPHTLLRKLEMFPSGTSEVILPKHTLHMKFTET